MKIKHETILWQISLIQTSYLKKSSTVAAPYCIYQEPMIRLNLSTIKSSPSSNLSSLIIVGPAVYTNKMQSYLSSSLKWYFYSTIAYGYPQ